MRRGERREGLEADALVDRGDERLLVDGVVDRAAHPHVVHRRLRDVEQPDARRARPRHLLDAHGGVLLDPGQRLGGHEVDPLRLAALERRHPRALLRDELPHDGVEVGGAAAVAPRRLPRIGGIPHHRRVVLGDVLLDHERPAADGAGVHGIAALAHRLGRDQRERCRRRRSSGTAHRASRSSPARCTRRAPSSRHSPRGPRGRRPP